MKTEWLEGLREIIARATTIVPLKDGSDQIGEVSQEDTIAAITDLANKSLPKEFAIEPLEGLEQDEETVGKEWYNQAIKDMRSILGVEVKDE